MTATTLKEIGFESIKYKEEFKMFVYDDQNAIAKEFSKIKEN